MVKRLSSYYNQLTPYYKYIYQDWESSVSYQGEALNRVIRKYFGEGVIKILDVSCGIGTQSLGLAERGYQLTGIDISPEAIESAKKEAEERSLKIDFFTADMRRIEEYYQNPFDLIMACDNSIPHLLSKKEILKAFKGFFRATSVEGGCLISVRDYSNFDRGDGKSRIYPRKIHHVENGRIIIFDVWDFEGDIYQITTFIIEESSKGDLKTTAIRGGRYFCIETGELEYLFLQAGFKRVITLPDVFFQPIIVAMK
jgi:SAM-dependent methyltransferase